MQENHTPSDITALYTEYLSGRGSTTMTSLLAPDSPLYAIARIQDGTIFASTICSLADYHGPSYNTCHPSSTRKTFEASRPNFGHANSPGSLLSSHTNSGPTETVLFITALLRT
jgi:hypothetical protein